MMGTPPRRRPPPPSVTLRTSVVVVAVVLVVLLLGGGMVVYTWIRLPKFGGAAPPPAPPPLVVPEVITKAPTRVVPVVAVPPPILATDPAGPTAPLAGLFLPEPVAPPQSAADPAGAGAAPLRQGSTHPRAPRRTEEDGGPAGTTPSPPAPRRWSMLARRTETGPPASTAGLPVALDSDGRLVPAQPALPSQGRSTGLIQPARWEIPAQPHKTIYRSQVLAGQLLHALQSDLPGQFTIRLTIPVLDKFLGETVILPMGTLVIAMQEATPVYGNTRIKVTLEQVELPSGAVVQLKGSIGEEDGSQGLAGKVNNHYGKLLLATGISAVVNIGAKSVVGTPGPQQFFPNPIQGAAADIGASVQQETQKTVDRELRVPPTITRKPLTFCTIHLQENIQFNRPPVVVK